VGADLHPLEASVTLHIDLLDRAGIAIVESIRGGIYPPGRRTQFQVAYCHLVIEHQFAIATLLEGRMTGSAFALARPAFEALAKGLWLYHCATDKQLEAQARGRELDQVAKLTDGLMLVHDLPAVITTSLLLVKAKYWKTLSSLTHVGHAQVRHWLNEDGVQANYPEAALHELANFASFMALVAGRELALRAGNEEGVVRLTGMLPELSTT
jgi:hypothetical protein